MRPRIRSAAPLPLPLVVILPAAVVGTRKIAPGDMLTVLRAWFTGTIADLDAARRESEIIASTQLVPSSVLAMVVSAALGQSGLVVWVLTAIR